ncbi:Hypothetical predicted protein [Xyrichtys novacula]|uniref:Uncharacterized protein n=1 Tax=Xyrichtys novacula TaxID=13765 RepID=A0AAV1FRX1_XYRNO|nr:Hypothetical predicted protein [Xyrichtys novacula]
MWLSTEEPSQETSVGRLQWRLLTAQGQDTSTRVRTPLQASKGPTAASTAADHHLAELSAHHEAEKP